MLRTHALLIAGVAVLGASTWLAASRPVALGGTSPGMWEISGLPGAQAPLRQCVATVETLGQFEHRDRSCEQKVLSDGASTAVIEYSCNGADFGRSKLTVITPRSLRIETQGISDKLPFSYVLQARRVGDCPERG